MLPSPLKEGRLSPRSKYKRRKSMLLRIARIIIAVIAAWLVICLFLRSPSDTSQESTSNLPADKIWQVWPTDIKIVESSVPQDTPDEKSVGENPALQENVEDPESLQPIANIVEDVNNNTNSNDPTPDPFEAALDYLLSTAPDELYVQEFLRPVTGTGEQRLHDLGLRTRVYKEFIQTWENVHLVTYDDNHTDVRNDIVPYIRDKFNESTYSHALHQYESYRHFVTKLSALLFPWTSPYFADHMSMRASLRHGGRGIVTTAGNSQAAFLLAAIPSFRLLGCDLPIEVMYLGKSDLNEDFQIKLEALPGVTTRDISAMVDDEGWRLNGWAGKPFAILFSTFREALFIDADALFFVNPELLFDDPDYVRTGALFFRDRNIFPESKRDWLQRILPMPISEVVQQSRMWNGISGHEQESGVIVVDKWKHFVALLLVCRMNGPDRNGNGADIVGTYDMVYGDKETFWLGWELAGDTSYVFHPGVAAVMGLAPPAKKFNFTDHFVDQQSDQQSDRQPKPTFVNGIAVAPPALGRTMAPDHESNVMICSPQLLHLDREKRPLWFNGWLFENKFATGKRVMAKFDKYMEEPSTPVIPEAWEIKEHNLCCLSNAAPRDFTRKEIEWLEELIEMANTVNN